MSLVAITAPAGYVGSAVVGLDGVTYPLVNGQAVLPDNAIGHGLWAAGFAYSAADVITGATGSSG